jgi:hypothetical protein
MECIPGISWLPGHTEKVTQHITDASGNALFGEVESYKTEGSLKTLRAGPFGLFVTVSTNVRVEVSVEERVAEHRWPELACEPTADSL